MAMAGQANREGGVPNPCRSRNGTGACGTRALHRKNPEASTRSEVDRQQDPSHQQLGALANIEREFQAWIAPLQRGPERGREAYSVTPGLTAPGSSERRGRTACIGTKK